MSEFTPTAEQNECLRLFSTGDDLAIEAGAGAGKTATLKLLAESCPSRMGQYVAFNKAIVEEAGRKFPANVTCSTIHSLAFRSVGKQYGQRLRNSRRMRSNDLARFLRVDPFEVRYGVERKRLAPGFLAGHVMRALENYCSSADVEPSVLHFGYIDGIDVPDNEGNRTYSNNDEVAAALEPALVRAWADAQNPAGQLPFKHSWYLKMWERSQPVILAEFLLVDEAQDISPVMASIIFQQRGRTQLVFVGDSAQSIYCQPSGTPVRVPVRVGGGRGRGGPRYEHRDVPIENLAIGDKVISYSVSSRALRRSGSAVTAKTVRHYDGPLVTIRTESGLASSYTPDHHCVALLGDALDGKQVVYVMRRGAQYRIGRCAWRYGSQANASGPYVRCKQERGDAFWILSAHETVAEAGLAEAIAGHQFGIPTLTFERGGANPNAVPVDEFWMKVGANTDAALACLSFFGRRIDAPLWDHAGGNLLQRRPIITRACNLMDGMRVLPADNFTSHNRAAYGWGTGWETITVSRGFYSGDIVSVSVENDHTYVADGIVTHNSFTGAINALGRIREQGVATAWLTESFRFGPAIADVANGLLRRAGHQLQIKGAARHASVVAATPEPRCVLTRTNAMAVRVVLESMEQGRKAALMGGGDEVRRFAEGAKSLMESGWTSHPDLACFTEWAQVVSYVADDPQGDDLRLLVKLIDEFGADEIITALGRTVREADADVVVSTAHKSKGCEWDSVQIAADFIPPKEGGDNPVEELRLMYVAATRARRELDVTNAPHFLAPLARPEPAPIPEAAPAADLPAEAPQSPAEARKACPLCGRTDVIRGGLVGAHRCEPSAVAR